VKRTTRRDPPACLDARAWLRANGHALGALTGQDARALSAIAHCWELYAVGDDAGRFGALDAVRSLLRAMQPQCHSFARELIARSLDWDDRERVWAMLKLDDEPDENTRAAFDGQCELCHEPIDGQGLCHPFCHRTIEQLPPVMP
jgi:hypothetical protein